MFGEFDEANFFLDDKLMTIRNDTTNTTGLTFVQEAYKFEGSELRWMGLRVLAANELNISVVTWIGEKTNEDIAIYDVYHRVYYNGSEFYNIVTFDESCVIKAEDYHPGNFTYNYTHMNLTHTPMNLTQNLTHTPLNLTQNLTHTPLNLTMNYSEPSQIMNGSYNTSHTGCYEIVAQVPFSPSDHIVGSNEI